MTLRRSSVLFGIIAASLVLSTCRYDTVWTGVAFDGSGETLRLSAAEPLCGCLQITNISKDMVHVRSRVGDRPLGSLNLEPNTFTRVHFDWGGPMGGDVFILDTWLKDGKQVDAEKVLRVDESGWPWQPCVGHLQGQPAPPKCEEGPLKLNTGRGQH
nr:hypothetical protein [uncultured bacterium]